MYITKQDTDQKNAAPKCGSHALKTNENQKLTYEKSHKNTHAVHTFYNVTPSALPILSVLHSFIQLGVRNIVSICNKHRYYRLHKIVLPILPLKLGMPRGLISRIFVYTLIFQPIHKPIWSWARLAQSVEHQTFKAHASKVIWGSRVQVPYRAQGFSQYRANPSEPTLERHTLHKREYQW